MTDATTSPPLELIDCHVLHLANQRDDWWQACRQSLEGQPINLHHLAGIPGDYTRARCEALPVGAAPFVSYVDPDDMVMAGAFARCLHALQTTDAAMVWTDSLVTYEDNPMAWARKLRPRRPHQLIVVRRDVMLGALVGGLAGDAELWRRVGQLGKVVHLDFVGYVWRDHRLTPAQKAARCLAQY